VSQSVEAFRNALRIPELKHRIIFTMIMLAVYRLGAHIPTPGVNGQRLAAVLRESGGGLLSFYDMFTGGAFENATIFALGIMPYISASIIMQLLVAVVPFLEKLHKEGAEGQKKITEYTRYGTIALCIVQSLGVSFVHDGHGVHHVAGRADQRARRGQRDFVDHLHQHRGADAFRDDADVRDDSQR